VVGAEISGLPDVVLVRGCPRSGTTLVAELINSSPDGAILVEYPIGALVRDLAPILAYGREYRSQLRRSVDGQRADVYASPAVDLSVARFPTPERLGSIVAAVVGASLDKPGARVIGSKTPGTAAVSDRAELEPLFSTIKYVFVVRDPLTTINSMINRRNRTRLGLDNFPWPDVASCIDEYRQNVRQLFSHAIAYPETCFVIKYEDLARRFAETAAQLGDFLGLRFEDGTPSLWGDADLRSAPAATRTVLTEDEAAAVHDAFGPAIADWPAKRLTGPAADAVDALADCVDLIDVDTQYRFTRTRADRRFLGLGWSVIEETGVWSDGERADLFFRVSRDGDYTVRTEASYFLPEERPALGVALDFDGMETFRATFVAGGGDIVDAGDGPWRIIPADGPKSVLCGPLALRSGRVHRLTFRFREPSSPRELGLSGDSRRMAAMLHSLLLVAS
jgi:hypothetical protein